jgi:hypothetical protein
VNELIWFSIPGAIFIAACAVGGFFVGLDSKIAIALALPIGFTIHQLFRTCFEFRDGWARKSRKVIALLESHYRLKSRQDAFILWEMTLYSHKTDGTASEVSEAFRKHNRDSWYYVLSFWSCAFISVSCALGMSLCALEISPLDLKWSSLFLGMFWVFWKKGNLTYAAVNDQEEAAFKLYRDIFDRIAEELDYKKVVKPETPVHPRSRVWGLILGFLKM